MRFKADISKLSCKYTPASDYPIDVFGEEAQKILDEAAMKAESKWFRVGDNCRINLGDCEEAALKFLSEIGPERLIQVFRNKDTSYPDKSAYIVWYWV